MAPYRKINVKTTEEWLELRKDRIGGSEISSVVGLNPWESRYELYMRKRGDSAPKIENMSMRLGHKLENAVAELLSEEAGYQIIKNTGGNLIYLSNIHPFAEASPDRIAYLPNARKTDDNKCIVEIKTTQKAVDENAIPEHWICQIQWYMGITGIHNGVIAWLTSGRDFAFKPIPFDEEFFNFLADEGRQFHEDVVNGVEPEAITARDIAVRYPRHIDGKSEEVSEDVAAACGKYKALKDQMKALETEMDNCEEIIKTSFKDAESITYCGLVVATYKSPKESEKFDTKAFKEANPDLAAQYIKIVPGSRRLNVK